MPFSAFEKSYGAFALYPANRIHQPLYASIEMASELMSEDKEIQLYLNDGENADVRIRDLYSGGKGTLSDREGRSAT
jgi:hypothetical protein